MAYLLVIIFILSIYHIYYECIIALSERQNLRYELFKLRDNLRMIKINEGDKYKDDVFYTLDLMLSKAISDIRIFNVFNFLQFLILEKKDYKLHSSHTQVLEKLNQCNIKEVKEIERELNEKIFKAIAINNGGLLPYIIAPFIIIQFLILIVGMKEKATKYCKSQINRFAVNETENTRNLIYDFT